MIVPIRSPQDCPSEVALANMAAGRVEPTERDSILEHVSTCERCGMALGEALSEPKENDLAALSIVKGLQTSKPAFQKQFAKRLAAGKSAAPWFKHLAIAASLAIACFGGWKWFRPVETGQLLAQAYTARRPFEARWPGSAHAPVRQSRGQSAFDRPPALLDAQAAIARDPKPEDADWLQLRGRAELLNQQPEAAVETLIHALELRPDDDKLKSDLAMAYLVRARQGDRAVDLARSIDLYSQVLRNHPRNAEAHFNRALATEKAQLVNEAIAGWQAYLALDGAGPWAEEARAHLKEQEEKKTSGAGRAPPN